MVAPVWHRFYSFSGSRCWHGSPPDVSGQQSVDLRTRPSCVVSCVGQTARLENGKYWVLKTQLHWNLRLCFCCASNLRQGRPLVVNVFSFTWAHQQQMWSGWNCCCVSIQGLGPSEEHLKANYVTMLREGSSRCGLLFLVLEGCTAAILLCVPKKEERNRENGHEIMVQG